MKKLLLVILLFALASLTALYIKNAPSEELIEENVLLEDTIEISEKVDTIPFWETKGYASYGHWLDAIPDEEQVVLTYDDPNVGGDGFVYSMDIFGKQVKTNLTFEEASGLSLKRSMPDCVRMDCSPYSGDEYVVEEDLEDEGIYGYHFNLTKKNLRKNTSSIVFDEQRTRELHGKEGKITSVGYLSPKTLLFESWQEFGVGFHAVYSYDIRTDVFTKLGLHSEYVAQMDKLETSPNGNFLLYWTSNRHINDHDSATYISTRMFDMENGTEDILSENMTSNTRRSIGWTTKSILREEKTSKCWFFYA